MTDTTTLLETALENEAKLLLKLISELENEELFDFAQRLAHADLRVHNGGPVAHIHAVAQNIKNISETMDLLFTV
jgi:hypothetical protein